MRISFSKCLTKACLSRWRICAFLVLASSGAVYAQSNPNPATHAIRTPLNLPTRSLASLQTYPLSAVHAGQRAVAYTVFQGSKPEPIDVEILGVLHDAIGPGKDMILIQLLGQHVEFTGVVAGMSGSPVYLDGKLLGAIGFRIGQFTKQPIAGVTPIEQMLQVVKQSTSTPQTSIAYRQSDAFAPQDATGGKTRTALIPGSNTTLQPIEAPLTFDGYSQEAIQLFRERFHSLGLSPVAGLGGASPEQHDPAPILPGSAISALIVSGDFNMAATCSVTYVDPKRLLACGHPITQFGSISLPMTKAEVVTTLASTLAPMKIVNTTQTVGSFTQDRESGIMGRFGKPARMIPVSLAIRGIPQPHTYHFAVVEHPRLTPGALTISIFQAMQDTNGSNDPATYNLHGEIALEGYPSVKINDMIAPDDQKPSSLGTAIAVAQRFDSIFSNPRQVPVIRSVSLTLDAAPGRRSAVIADARVLSPNVHAGESITVETTLHPYREPQRIVRLSMTLPKTLAPGPCRLLVSDGGTMDHTLHLIPNPALPAIGLEKTIAQLNALHPTDRLYVTLLAGMPQAMMQGQPLPSVPLTMANVLQTNEGSGGVTMDGETALPLKSEQVGMSLQGSRILTLNVQP